MMGGPLQESSWDEIAGRLRIQIANQEKDLLLLKAQLKEAELNQSRMKSE